MAKDWIKHELIKPETLESREYQLNLAKNSLDSSTLIILPTGLGKTVVALLVIAERLKKIPLSKILFLAPTRPLVEQHAAFLKNLLNLEGKSINILTGEVDQKERAKLWGASILMVATPQVIVNDLKQKRINLEDVSVVVFDEAHRGIGNYAYVKLAEVYQKMSKYPLILGMTASPGSNPKHILAVCKNLGIQRVDIRTMDDEDVRPYVYGSTIEWEEVDLPPEFIRVKQALMKAFEKYINGLQKSGFLRKRKPSAITKTELLRIQKEAQAKRLFNALINQAAAMKVEHALELLSTQGVTSLNKYFSRLQTKAKGKEGGRADRILLRNPNFIDAVLYASYCRVEHPKISRLLQVVRAQFEKKSDSTIIVFTHYRDTAEKVVDLLSKFEEIRPVRFVGQAVKSEDRGLTQKEQVEILEKFKQKVYNVLVATSVAEEGLDIPSTDMVIFYEPIPSEIRTIQRRGRTGRAFPGKVVILIAKGTKDEAYYWSAQRKEKRMKKNIEKLKKGLTQYLLKEEKGISLVPKQSVLTDFS
jgi:Fanconi anemia group M protein